MKILRPHEAPERPIGNGRASPLRIALEQVVVGGFVFVGAKERSAKSTSASVYHLARRLRRRFTCREMVFEGVAGCGIWRLQDPLDPDADWREAIVREAAGLAVPARVGRPQLKVAGR